MAEVRLYCGPQRSGRIRVLDDLMRAHWEEAIFLVPTRQLGARRTERLILEGDNIPGAWGRRVLTFEDFARWLLETSHSDARPIDEFERTMLLQEAVAAVKARGKLDALGWAADSPGFLNHVQRVIAQLKQAAIEPDEFRRRTAKRAHRSPLDGVVAEVYEAYQAMLIEQHLYDRQGVYWEANELVRNDCPEVLRRVRVLLLDGFDDYTPSEFRLLEALEQRLDLLVFGLNYDVSPDRQDLYRLTAATADKIRQRFSPRVITFEGAPPESYTKHASANLFGRDMPVFPDRLRPDLEVQPCPGLVTEVEHVGRRVKSLLLEGVPAEEIVVVYRDLDGVAGIVRSVFGEFGIPVRVVKRPCLGESAVCGFLLDVLEAVDGWDRETVVDVLTSAWFRPADERDRLFLDAIPSLARLAQIVAGYREWTERLNALVGRLNEAGEEEAGHDDPDRADPDLFARYVRHMPDAPQAAQALLDRVDRLASIAVGLPSRAGMCQHLLALERLIEACGIPEAIVRHPVPEVRAAEASALATLRALLAQIYAWCETQPEVVTISRSELLLRLRKAFDETPYEPGDPRDAVACLDAEAVRGLRFDYVFFCGVNEGQIPKAPPSNAVYSDEDLEELERLDIHLDGRQGRSDPELLLFHRVLDVPRRHLTITYRTLAPDGKALRPSPFLEDLIDLFPADAGVLRPPIAASAFVPAPEHAASWRDLRNAAFDGATGLRRVFAEELWRVERGCLLEERRHDSTPLDVFDGVIADEALRARLTERFGEGHIYSVSQIEAYVRCPFAYYAVRVLGVLDIEPPSEEFDTRLMGTLLHDVLQAFHRHYRRRSICDLEETEAATAMSDFLELVFARAMRQALNVPSGVAAVIRRQVETILARYLRHCRKDEERRWEPAHFEVTFGEYRKTFEDPLDRPDPLCLTTSQGKVLFKGRIDRIDIAGDGCARIIDYKSSTPPTKGSMEDGVSLQLPLYALAVAEHLLPDLNCEGAYFLHLGRDKWVEGMDRTSKKDGWPDRRATALGAVARAVQGIRIGNFPPQPQANACRFCPAAPACRYEPARIERKRSEKADEADN